VVFYIVECLYICTVYQSFMKPPNPVSLVSARNRFVQMQLKIPYSKLFINTFFHNLSRLTVAAINCSLVQYFPGFSSTIISGCGKPAAFAFRSLLHFVALLLQVIRRGDRRPFYAPARYVTELGAEPGEWDAAFTGDVVHYRHALICAALY
jgi:hypothetical protein